MPRSSGIRGVTLEDVAGVGAYGSQAMPRSETLVDRYRSGRTAPLTTSDPVAALRITGQPIDLSTQLFGEMSPTAGEKFAGYRTQSDLESAIAGRAFQILEQADLARRLAEENQARILAESNAAEAERTLPILSAVDEARAALPGINPFRPGFMERAQQYPEALTNLGRAQTTAQILTGPLPQEMAGLPVIGLGGTIATEEANRAVGRMASEVDPYLAVARGVEQYTPAELARNIAVQQYAMDPNLAYGTFTDDFTTQYYKDLLALDQAQRAFDRLQGGFFDATLEEQIFDNYGQKGLDDYYASQAAEALGRDPESRAKAFDQQTELENAAIDADLAKLYGGLTPETITTKVDTNYVRKYMQDPLFNETFIGMAELYGPTGEEFVPDATSQRQKVVKAAIAEYPDDPVAATVLADILLSWTLLGT
jgi:hypothetical protein